MVHALPGPPVPVTIPADQRWSIVTITAFYPGGTVAPGVQIIDQGTGATIWWDSASISPAGEFRYWTQLRLVLTEGHTYDLVGSGIPDLSLNGYLLTP